MPLALSYRVSPLPSPAWLIIAEFGSELERTFKLAPLPVATTPLRVLCAGVCGVCVVVFWVVVAVV